MRSVVQNATSKSHKRSDSTDCASTSSSGYFSKFAETGTPFDVYSELDGSQLDEDILLADVSSRSSVYNYFGLLRFKTIRIRAEAHVK